jgi:hypothetical protein
MAEYPYGKLYEFISSPGIRRDGTALDSPFYSDGVWVRFQRGKPRKMGGYKGVSQLANAPVRSVLIDSRNGTNSAHYFSQWGVQRQVFSNTGTGGSLEDRTPLVFTRDEALTWSHGVMTSSTGGSFSALLAASAPDLNDIASDDTGFLYTGDIATDEPLTVVSDGSGPIEVSGGVCVLQPFCFVYGSNGLIRNSAANDFTSAGWSGEFSNAANVAGTKFVYGAPVRGGGQSPAGLFWALDALVRVSFLAGDGASSPQWAYDTLSQPTSILGKKCVVEHDGKFFWIGTDRFLFYNGVVQELRNEMNANYFFEGLNPACRNKVWGTKVPRFGEIWWFYPRGTDTECGHAVIYNYLQDTWYDAVRERTAGDSVVVFPYPVWAGHENTRDTELLVTGTRLEVSSPAVSGASTLVFADTAGVVDGMVVSGSTSVPYGTTVLSHAATFVTLSTALTDVVADGAVITFTSMTSAFSHGDEVTGSTSGAIGTAVRVQETALNVVNVTGEFQFGETITGGVSATAVLQDEPIAQQLDTAYQQEFGYDKIIGQNISAIPSSFTSKEFGYAVGAPFAEVPQTIDAQTNLVRLEPDFDQVGALSLIVEGRSFANKPNQVLETYEIIQDQAFVDIRQQERILRVTLASNTMGGFYQQGQVMMTLSVGDERSSEAT